MRPLFQDSLKWVPPQFQKEVKFRMRLVRDRQIQDARLTSWVLVRFSRGGVIDRLRECCQSSLGTGGRPAA